MYDNGIGVKPKNSCSPRKDLGEGCQLSGVNKCVIEFIVMLLSRNKAKKIGKSQGGSDNIGLR